MKSTIAVSGKGGVGKTTIAAMMIRELIARSTGAVLGVDADPNACLAFTLGVETTGSIADLREQTRNKQPSNAGIDRLSSFEYGLEQIIVEAKGFDLVTMGRPEGRDCYCAVNNLLRKYLDQLGSRYNFIVLDNEAGMEHLSRRTTNKVDLLCIIAEHSPIGEMTAQRIFELTKALEIEVKRTGIIWNKAETPIQLTGIPNFGSIPCDQAVIDASMQGKTIFDINSQSPAFQAVRDILDKNLDLEKVSTSS
ncbi:MAG: ATP-binding protein [Planctomycetota bacterium]|jgi:CO dehydrogenase maturation factor